jgi:hypothetical protein
MKVHRWASNESRDRLAMCGRLIEIMATTCVHDWAQVTCKRCLLRKGRP